MSYFLNLLAALAVTSAAAEALFHAITNWWQSSKRYNPTPIIVRRAASNILVVIAVYILFSFTSIQSYLPL